MFHPKLFVISIEIITISTYIHFCSSRKQFIRKTSKSPEIWLASYQQTDSFEDVLADQQFRTDPEYENEFVSKFNETDYIIEEDIRQVVFVCQATYPVMWHVPHLKQVVNLPFEMFKIESVRVANFFDQIPNDQYFRTFLTINLDGYIGDVFSVNFTCGSPNYGEMRGHKFSEHASSSIHLYYSQTQQVIESFGNIIQINVSKSFVHDVLTIPCRPARPAVPIKLEKEVLTLHTNVRNDQTKRKWKEINNFEFDPKYGFKVDQTRKESVFGLYRCCVSVQEHSCDGNKNEQLVLVNVTLDTSYLPKPTIKNVKFEPGLNLKGNAFLKYGDNVFGKNTPPRNFQTSNFRNDELWCCSGVDNDRPVIYSRACTNPLQCEILKKSMTLDIIIQDDNSYKYASYRHSSVDPEDCVANEFYGEDSVVFCKGENVQFADNLIKLFRSDILPISQRKDQIKQINLRTYEPESSEAASNITRRIFLTVGQPIKSHYQYGRHFVELIRSNEPQYVEMSVDYLDDDERHLTNTNIAFSKPMKSLFNAEYSRDYFYKGEPLIPVCFGLLSFYSRGAFVRVVFANGSSTVLNVQERKEPSKYVMYFSEGLNVGGDYFLGKLVEYKFGKEILAHKDMVAFECWMPQWNTEKWDKVKFELKILEPTNPRFLEKESNVYLVLGKENQTVEWGILEGSPAPRIDVMVDGQKIYKGNLKDFDEFNFETDHVFDDFNLTVERENGTGFENDTSHVVVVKIWFNEAIHEIQGMYQCKISNVGGTVTQSFKVIVTENRSSVLVLIIVFTISLLLITIFAGLIVKYWRPNRN